MYYLYNELSIQSIKSIVWRFVLWFPKHFFYFLGLNIFTFVHFLLKNERHYFIQLIVHNVPSYRFLDYFLDKVDGDVVCFLGSQNFDNEFTFILLLEKGNHQGYVLIKIAPAFL